MAEAEWGLAVAAQRGAVFYLRVMFLTDPEVKKQWSQAPSASLQGKPGEVNPKWGCAASLAYSTTAAAAVTARFK